MSEVVRAFPLQWPASWKRTPPGSKRHGRFFKGKDRVLGEQTYRGQAEVSVADAVERIRRQLRLMDVQEHDIVISTNLKLRLDGAPRSDQPQPKDTGAAVYWLAPYDPRQASEAPRRCMAIDLYERVEHNLAAIASTLEALRQIERHGGAAILDRAFSGFTALPSAAAGQRPWRDVLGFGSDFPIRAEVVKEEYQKRRSQAHPDKGGSHEQFLIVQAAYEAAARELGFQP